MVWKLLDLCSSSLGTFNIKLKLAHNRTCSQLDVLKLKFYLINLLGLLFFFLLENAVDHHVVKELCTKQLETTFRVVS